MFVLSNEMMAAPTMGTHNGAHARAHRFMGTVLRTIYAVWNWACHAMGSPMCVMFGTQHTRVNSEVWRHSRKESTDARSGFDAFRARARFGINVGCALERTRHKRRAQNGRL